MKIDIKKLRSSLIGSVGKIRPYLGFIFVLLVALTYGLLILRIASLNNAQPSDTLITEKIQQVNKSKIDQNAVDKIEELQDQNVEVEAIFKHARDNPFSE